MELFREVDFLLIGIGASALDYIHVLFD